MLSLTRFAKTFALPLWKWYFFGALFLAATNIITLEIPQLAKQIVNELESRSLGQGELENVSIMIILLGLLQFFCRSLSRILIFWPGRTLEASSKLVLFGKTLSLPQKFIDSFGMGDLISRLSNDLGQVRVFFAFAILQILNMSFLTAFTVYKMFAVHVSLSLLCLTPILFMLILAKFFMPKFAQFSKQNQEAIGRLTNKVTEAFSHIHVIQANGAASTFHRNVEKENSDVYETNMTVVKFRTLFFPLISSLTSVSQLAVISYGGYQVFNGSITVGDLLAFNIYLGYLAFPLTSLGIVMSIYQRSKTALERLSPLSEASPESVIPSSEKQDTEALLLIKNLSYRYEDDKKEVLKDFNLAIQAGQKIGICGPVGAGKTSLLKLITRIIDPPPGTIFWRGIDVRSIEPSILRKDIGLALQSAQLFSSSISENISFGMEPAPTKEQLIEAAAQAQVLEDIEQLPQGWNTQIGEKGVRLSGGQKQRLSLARLFIRKPQLLLLDDVLSAVDNRTEMKLTQFINSNPFPAIVVSHRSSVLKACSLVLVLEEGAIIDMGSFNDVAARHPHIQEDIAHED